MKVEQISETFYVLDSIRNRSIQAFNSKSSRVKQYSEIGMQDWAS